MARTGENERRARRLFWAQVALGVVAGVVITSGSFVLGAGPEFVLWLVTFDVVCVGGTIAGLLSLERRKPIAEDVPDVPEWARRVEEMRASRREIVGAFEVERRRIERDLHDGAQQHIVTGTMKLGEAAMLLDGEIARASSSGGPGPTADSGPARTGAAGQGAGGTGDRLATVATLLAEAQDDADRALKALRQTVSGIHPTVLSDRGLEPAVRELAGRSAVPVTVRVPHPLPSLPEGVAAVAYFLISEALTNVAKHAPGASATVLLVVDDALHVSVTDDGPGGAHVSVGRGLGGMSERLAAVGSKLEISSPAGGPTFLSARVPLLLDQGESAVVVGSAGDGRDPVPPGGPDEANDEGDA